jgi:hypothetical protein
MIKKILFLVIFISTLSFGDMARKYIDFEYALLNYSNSSTNKDFQLNGYKLTAGYMLFDFSYLDIGVESSIMVTKGEAQNLVTIDNGANINGVTLNDATVDVDLLYTAYMKATAPIVDILYGNLYLGWDRAKVSSKAKDYNRYSKWDDSLSYGVGLEYWIPMGVSLKIDYMSYFNNLNSVEFGFGFKF